jgi:hypothetical protein
MIRNGPISTKTFVRSDYNLQYRYVKAAIEGTGVTLTVTQNNSGDRLIRDIYGEANSNYATTDVHLKFIALYGMLGGTEGSHRFNWVDTRDNSSAFRLVFPNGATHSSTGVDWDGSTQYANTFISPSVSLSQDSTHMSYYSREDGTGVLMGIDANFRLWMSSNFSGLSYAQVNDSAISNISTVNGQGMFLVSRTGSTTKKYYKNAVEIINSADASTGLDSGTIILAGRNVSLISAPTLSNPSNQQCALASIGSGLTPTETTNFYNAVQAYQTSLSRQVP